MTKKFAHDKVEIINKEENWSFVKEEWIVWGVTELPGSN